MLPKPNEKEAVNVKWLKPKILAVRNGLIKKKDSHQSGNGWKPSVWPEIVAAVQALSLGEASQRPDQFELYLFMEKFSGTGWDDEVEHATNTEDYVKDFLAVWLEIWAHGKKYAPCFKKAFPYYAEMNELYDGLKNRASGKNIVHFPKKRKLHATVPETAKENPTVPDLASPTKAGPSVEPRHRPPMTALNNVPHNEQNTAESQDSLYNDELTLVHVCSPFLSPLMHVKSPPKQPTKHISSSVARHNAEAGSQIACSIDNLSVAMLKPIVTSEDILHVDNVMRILADPTLHPLDPRGKIFHVISSALTRSPTQARIFILTEDTVHHKGIIAGWHSRGGWHQSS
ncbi:hypothetical protein B0H10DRAFT_1956738 [Mycena sp. CBHHK59/15]|nr:hypothetical protein B0H10DRAFT_1956738 [Mycena sp. CBHHK59/15]